VKIQRAQDEKTPLGAMHHPLVTHRLCDQSFPCFDDFRENRESQKRFTHESFIKQFQSDQKITCGIILLRHQKK
jgi:hypothetical protein